MITHESMNASSINNNNNCGLNHEMKLLPPQSSESVCTVPCSEASNNNSTRGSFNSSISDGVCGTVHFGEIRIREIDYIDAKHVKKVWYSKIEMEYLQSKDTLLANKIDELYQKNGHNCDISSVIDEKRHSLRGMEHMLVNSSAKKRRMKMQSKSRNAVFYEQNRQKTMNQQGDAEMIAEYYRLNGSEACTQLARKIGLNDERIAQEIRLADEEKEATMERKKPTKHNSFMNKVKRSKSYQYMKAKAKGTKT